MASLNLDVMRSFLTRSISSMNRNKLNGLLAEVELRDHLSQIGFAGQISPGGWIARREGAGEFGRNTVVMFPETVAPDVDYSPNRQTPTPNLGLHTICATFHQSGIAAFFCAATIASENDYNSLSWQAVQLGLPTEQPFESFPACLADHFRPRTRRYNFLKYRTNAEIIPREALPEEFSKEHLRVSFQTSFMSEISDVDGIFWGRQYTYPLEIKEKTVANDQRIGEYFGLDLGPFVKLAFYAAKRGNLHSLFVVREIDSIETRNLVAWWYITYETLAQYASWVPQGGGTNMGGGGSTVVKIPKAKFRELNRANLDSL